MSEFKEWAARQNAVDSMRINFDGRSNIDSVLILLNEYRLENGSKPLVLSENLCKVADLQAQYCADNSILTHDQNDEEQSSVFLRGLKYNERNVMAEVAQECHFDLLLLRNITIPSFIIENFKTSLSHAQIMRDEEYISCGISLIQSKNFPNYFYVIIVFSTN